MVEENNNDNSKNNDSNDKIKMTLPLPVLIDSEEELSELNDILKNIIFELTNEADKKNIKYIEEAIGRYIKYTDLGNNIIEKLFPPKNKIMNSIPLLPIKREQNNKYSEYEDIFQTAWANEMYELGMFQVDDDVNVIERYSNSLFFKYKMGKNEEYNITNGKILDTNGIVKNIWTNFSTYNIEIIFIDDNEDFPKVWGINDLCHKNHNEENSNNKSLYWFESWESYSEKMKDISKENQKLKIFIIDLLFKGKIIGDRIIQNIREKYGNKVLILAFTGGRSPFIYDSAIKSGADFVIYKHRGGEGIQIGHNVAGGDKGLFDLLWAISKNITVWQYLENLKYSDEGYNEKIERMKKIFPNIKNLSLFWEYYIHKWGKECFEKVLTSGG